MNQYTIEIDGIGPVLFVRSKRAKQLSISIKPFSGVRAAVPYRISFKKAEEFVCLKSDWILKHLDRMKEIEQRHESASRHFADIDRASARKILTGRLKCLAQEHGFVCNKVSIRNQKTRWGSCSAKNDISLNMKLVRLPDDLIDYIILHELLHTRIKNHGRYFFAELDKLVGNAREMRSRLREYGVGLL